MTDRITPPADVPPRALVRLAEEAARCAPDSCGAVATVALAPAAPAARAPLTAVLETEPATAVTHPDLAPLVAVQWEAGDGPIPAAVRSGEPAAADDLLADRRWPAYRAVALKAGVRSSATLPFRHQDLTVTVTVCGFRPGALDDRSRSLASLVGDLAANTLADALALEQVRTEAAQLDVALRSRPVIDQACGILMHLLGCDAETAFDLLRRRSQRTNSRLSDLAEAVVRTRGRGVGPQLTREARTPREAPPAPRTPARTPGR